MEGQLTIGDRVQLLANRGLNKKGDVLTIKSISGPEKYYTTEEMYDSNNKHFLMWSDINRQYILLKEECYEIY